LDYESNSEDHTYAITGNDRFTANSNFTIPHYVVIDNEEYVVTIIGNGAFWGCVGLKGVNLGGVTAIGNTAFWGCPLERIGVDQDNSAFELIGTSTNGFIRKTSDGEGDTITPACGTSGGIACGSITFPNDALTISDYAFRECIGITGVDLANVTTIDNNAFYGCIGMTGVDLRGVTTIGDSAFVGCPIEEINVAQNNTVYHLEGTSTNGFILRTGDDDTLTPACGTRGGIACGSITIPEGFDTIDEGTFYACGGLTRVDFDSTTIIGGRAFFGCERISEIDLSNVTDLGMD
jgi:putative transposon-encoded protein